MKPSQRKGFLPVTDLGSSAPTDKLAEDTRRGNCLQTWNERINWRYATFFTLTVTLLMLSASVALQAGSEHEGKEGDSVFNEVDSPLIEWMKIDPPLIEVQVRNSPKATTTTTNSPTSPDPSGSNVTETRLKKSHPTTTEAPGEKFDESVDWANSFNGKNASDIADYIPLAYPTDCSPKDLLGNFVTLFSIVILGKIVSSYLILH